MESTEANDTPFSTPAPADWQKRWVNAVLATDGANVPRAALEQIAPFVVQPKALLYSPRAQDKAERLRDDVLVTIRTDAGTALAINLKLAGYAGTTWWHNERISTAFRSPVDPSDGTKPNLPAVRPWTAVTTDGEERTYSALRSEFRTLNELLTTIERSGNELAGRDGHRPYDLREDLVLNGQMEPCMYIAQQLVLDEASVDTSGGQRPSSYWAWPAVRGNNRTKARQELLGLSSAEVVTGVPMAKLGMDSRDVSTNPAFWIPKYSAKLNAEYKTAREEGNLDAAAYRSRKVAIVAAHLVIGSPSPERLYRIVQSSNRRDHVHPPLEFKPNDRSRSLGRSILGAYSAAGILNEDVADVLAGTQPISRLTNGPGVAPISVQRDWRSMRLLSEFFPGEEDIRRQLIRAALSEPSPSTLARPHVNRRLRAWSALTSESYPEPWNPRVADALPVALAKEGAALSGRPLQDLLASANDDADAFEELLLYRAPHWLAAFDLIDADRGSVGAQRGDSDTDQTVDNEESLRIRRGVNNAIAAMRANRARAVGLLRELAAAMDESDRQPMQIGESGELLDKPASRAWFNKTFPKVAGATRANATPPQPDAAEAPPETDTEAVKRLRRELADVLTTLEEGAKLLPTIASQMRTHARAANIAQPLSDSRAQSTALQVTALLQPLRELPEVLLALGNREA
ncbi:hypothetical protein [Streptomyces yunnanensis]|uniref:Uncharacterized protein n=1 Tax=Streptomyces yunnanensis TaxID=156453 RepID=A0A9X8MNT7_9ACTN|nr:hypothetical protein [Streptomyces yunnanensis]SHL21140.1 hypothetical protein SAMN05216268_103221 [Streptomyces yunnanensis]